MTNIGFIGKPRIYVIEINDEKINNEIAEFLYRTGNVVNDLIQTLQMGDVPGKIEDSKSLLNIFLNLKKKTNKLEKDLNRIVNIELQRKRYIILKDGPFINDKLGQVRVMQEHLDNLIEMLKEDPTDADYKTGLLKVMLAHLNNFVEAVNRIRADDGALEKIYRELAEL